MEAHDREGTCLDPAGNTGISLQFVSVETVGGNGCSETIALAKNHPQKEVDIQDKTPEASTLLHYFRVWHRNGWESFHWLPVGGFSIINHNGCLHRWEKASLFGIRCLQSHIESGPCIDMRQCNPQQSYWEMVLSGRRESASIPDWCRGCWVFWNVSVFLVLWDWECFGLFNSVLKYCFHFICIPVCCIPSISWRHNRSRHYNANDIGILSILS